MKLGSIKRICLLVVTLFLLSSVFSAFADVGGICASNNDKFNHRYTLTGNGASDVIAVAADQEGMTKSNLGYTGAWCAAFVNDCAFLAGQASAIPFESGKTHGVDGLRTKVLANGGKVVAASERKKGDLRFYYCTVCKSWCHVGFCYDSANTRLEGNVGGKVQKFNSYYIR